MSNKSSKKGVLLAIFAVIVIAFLACLGKLGEDVPNNQIIVNQYPFTGTMAYWTTPGWKYQGFGHLTEYYKTHQVWFNEISRGEKGELSTMGLDNPAYPITYSDKGKGYILGSVRIELPTTDKHLNLIQSHYGSEKRLMDELIKPTLGKVILACGPLMTSLESVSEKRNDLLAYASDQIENGIYATRAITVEKLNSITGEMEKIQQAEIITDSLGLPLRNERSPFATYGLKVSQLSIADLEYESATNDQIAKQREADMDIITAKAEAAKAIQQTIKTEEEGKQKAAAAKWEQEVLKAKAVTEAQQEFEVAALNAKKADEEAKKIIAEGKANAESNRLKVQAGLTPQERAEWDYKTTVGVAEALAKSNQRWVPEIMMSGSGSSNNAMDAVGLNMLMEITKKMNVK